MRHFITLYIAMDCSVTSVGYACLFTAYSHIVSLSFVSGKLALLHDGYVVAIENCCVPMVVKHTLLAMR